MLNRCVRVTLQQTTPRLAAAAQAAVPRARWLSTAEAQPADAAKQTNKTKDTTKKSATKPVAPAAAAAAAATPAATPASSSSSPAAAASKPAPAAASVASSLWGPASGTLPLEAFSATPRVHKPRTHNADGSPVARPVPIRTLRLAHDDPNSHAVQTELFAAVVVERWPKIMQEEAEWKSEYKRHFSALRKRKEQAHAIPEELEYREADDVDSEGRRRVVADAAPVHVTPEALLTEADVARDLHATHRALQESLFLLVKRRGGGPLANWSFPTAPVPFDVATAAKEASLDAKTIAAALLKDSSPAAQAAAASALAILKEASKKEKVSLRSVGASAIAATVGTHAGVYFVGNAPLTVYRQFKGEGESLAKKALAARDAHSAARRLALETGNTVADLAAPAAPAVVGSKTFYMHALYMDGEIRLQNSREFEDYAWVKKSELAKYIGEEPARLLQQVLLDPKA